MRSGFINTLTAIYLSIIALAAPLWARAQADPPEAEQNTFDCGTLALYHLLRLEGPSLDLMTIPSHLPAMPPAGYSMKELRDAARACGLRLSGLRLKDPVRELDRPMIAFLRHGHYIVVRPVGHSGKLVQVLDGTEDSRIMDKEVFFAGSGWTGLVLAPRKSSLADRAVVPIVCLSGLGILLWFRPRLRLWAGRWTSRRMTVPESPALPGEGPADVKL